MNFQQFREEFKKLQLSLPAPPQHEIQAENAEYADYVYFSTNVFFSFENSNCENIIYLFDSFKSKNSCDGDYIIESEGCYDSVDTVQCYNCTYINYCSRLYDSHFCWDCSDGSNLFGCAHLQYKEYCIFNKEYTKEEYEQKVAELKKRPYEENLAEMEKIAQQFPVTTTHMANCENSDYGNQVFYGKNLYLCFDSAYSEDSAYLYDSHHNKHSFDFTQSHWSEFSYECIDSDHVNNSYYLIDCAKVFDSGFSDRCDDSNHLFGCIGLVKKEYCILNKQYTPEEYDKQVKEIMASFKENPVFSFR